MSHFATKARKKEIQVEKKATMAMLKTQAVNIDERVLKAHKRFGGSQDQSKSANHLVMAAALKQGAGEEPGDDNYLIRKYQAKKACSRQHTEHSEDHDHDHVH